MYCVVKVYLFNTERYLDVSWLNGKQELKWVADPKCAIKFHDFQSADRIMKYLGIDYYKIQTMNEIV